MLHVTTSTGTTYEIRFKHFNYESESNGKQRITHVSIYNGQLTTVGMFFSHPKLQFSRSLGRKWALKRALENLRLSKEERTEIWNEYFRYHRK